MKPIYLDHAATTPVRREVREAMRPFFDDRFGNPSSVHRWGRDARAALEDARARLAEVLGAQPSEIVFTRGGTEADNLAILGRSRAAPSTAVVCSTIEHKAVLASGHAAEAEGNPLHLLRCDGRGRVDETALEDLLSEKPAVVSVMWVNNEIGVVQPVRRLAERCAAAGVPFHTDAVQALGKVAVRMDEVSAAMASFSAHKIGGPKGVGALYVRRGTKLMPLIHGGGHERGLRAGTEDVAGAMGLAVAAELAVAEREGAAARIGALRDRLEAGLIARVADLVVNGAGTDRAPHVCNVSVPGVSNEALLLTLDMEGIAASSGSACSSGAVTPSHVLGALGLPPEIAAPSVRFSLGSSTTEEEIDRVLSVFPPLMERLRTLAATH
jgi:cysteine desulfurase